MIISQAIHSSPATRILLVLLTLFLTVFVLLIYTLHHHHGETIERGEFNQIKINVNHLEYFNQLTNLSDQIAYVKDIATEYGGAYALELLIASDPIAGGDLHLLGHYAGDQLYKDKGLEGMKVCTPDLWYACSHSIVIGALFEMGMSVFDQVHDVCRKVPGPRGYLMCFHGFGHGVIAYTQYEVPEAVELCKKVGTEAYDNAEAKECFGGVIMDLRDGLHDRELWEAYGRKYIPEGNPIGVCEAEYVPNDFKHMCYVFLTPFLFDYVGTVDIASEQEVAAALALCEEVPTRQAKQYCYQGFPKEFISYIHNRNLSAYENTTDEQFLQMYSWCLLSQSELGVTECVKSSVQAIDRAGTAPYDLTIRFCSLLGRTEHQDICYNELTFARAYANIHPDENEGYCSAIPEKYEEMCLHTMNLHSP